VTTKLALASVLCPRCAVRDRCARSPRSSARVATGLPPRRQIRSCCPADAHVEDVARQLGLLTVVAGRPSGLEAAAAEAPASCDARARLRAMAAPSPASEMKSPR